MPLQINVNRFINHTAIKIGPSETIPSSFSTVKPIKFSPVFPQNYTVPFISMKKSLKTFDELDLYFTPEKFLHQADVHVVFTMGEREQLLDLVACEQQHKRKTESIQ